MSDFSIRDVIDGVDARIELDKHMKLVDAGQQISEEERTKFSKFSARASEIVNNIGSHYEDRERSETVSSFIYDVVKNQGYSERYDKRFKWSEFTDHITSEQVKQYVPATVRYIIKNEVEPRTPISTMLFDNIQVDTDETLIELGTASNAFTVEEVAEASAFDIAEFSVGSGEKVSTHLRKYGKKTGITKEAKQYDTKGWNQMQLFFRGMASAFARKRETIAMTMLLDQGFIAYDNFTPTGTIFGQTTGRDINGGANGTLAIRDLNYQIAWMQNRGYNPDTIIMNPLAWIIFASIPEVRESMIVGGGLRNLDIPTGVYSPDLGRRIDKRGTNYVAKGESDPSALTSPYYKLGSNPNAAAINLYGRVFEFRGGMFPNNMKLILSPFVPLKTFTTGAQASDVIIVDSNHVGAFLNQTTMQDLQWFQVENEIEWVALYTRFGVLPYSKGEGISIAKNVVMDEQFEFDNVNSVSLTPPVHFPASGSILNP